MALRPAAFLALLSLTALAGCSEGGSGGGAEGYPDAYMMGTYGVPDGYVLMDDESDEWMYTQSFGLESNPGYADPQAFAMAEDSEEDGSDEPLPKRLYVAVYIEEGYDPEQDSDFIPPLIMAMAAEMEDSADADQTIPDAQESCAGEDGIPMYMLRDGLHFAVAMAFDAELADELAGIADEIEAATGAERIC